MVAEVNSFQFPNDTQRVAIVGRTGSGKTQFACWLLSELNYTEKPWVIFDFKGDDFIAKIPGTKSLSITGNAPSSPGIYITRPTPDDTENVEAMLWKIWESENVGIYIDEGYMMTGLKGFRACLTQGRSKHIPMIVLSQRPVWIDRFVWSEADFYSVFSLNTESDRAKVFEYVRMPEAAWRLPAYQSMWYDVAAHRLFRLKPAPSRASILRTYRERIGITRKAI